MTLHATRDGQAIIIHGNTGVDLEVRNSQLAGVHIKENAQHVRHFHASLGHLLDAADKERDVPEPEHAPEHHGHHGEAAHGATGTHHGPL